MKTLFINACVRKNSRTKILADYFLKKINGEIVEHNLEKEDIKPLCLNELKKRDELILKKDFKDLIFKYANDFKTADTIVIAAPFWDLSFPSLLKIYIENININGLVFEYEADGTVKSLCRAKKLFYITTSGGMIDDESFGFGYIKALSKQFYKIPEITLIKAEKLDIIGQDVNLILNNAKQKIDFLKI